MVFMLENSVVFIVNGVIFFGRLWFIVIFVVFMNRNVVGILNRGFGIECCDMYSL